jgi:hypothetical protein
LLKIITNKQRLTAFTAKIEQPPCLVLEAAKGAFKMGDIHEQMLLKLCVNSRRTGVSMRQK